MSRLNALPKPARPEAGGFFVTHDFFTFLFWSPRVTKKGGKAMEFEGLWCVRFEAGHAWGYGHVAFTGGKI